MNTSTKSLLGGISLDVLYFASMYMLDPEVGKEFLSENWWTVFIIPAFFWGIGLYQESVEAKGFKSINDYHDYNNTPVSAVVDSVTTKTIEHGWGGAFARYALFGMGGLIGHHLKVEYRQETTFKVQLRSGRHQWVTVWNDTPEYEKYMKLVKNQTIPIRYFYQ